MTTATLDTPLKNKSLEERWDWIITFMVLEDRFVHEMLMMMEKRSTKSISTMGVSVEGSRLLLYYNPEFVAALTDPELRYIITHEVYHVALHHCTIRLPENPEDRELYNRAADLAINSLIPEDTNRHMPKDPKLEGLRPKKMGFEEKLSMEQYLQLLREQEQNDKKNGKGGKGNGGKGGYDGFDDHSGWNETEVMKEIIRNKIEQLAKDERVWGKMPGDVKALIMAAQQSYVNWTRYLKHYLGNLVTSKNEFTMKRPNRRFGWPYPGTKRLHTDRKLVAIDTSGSIGDDELAQFLAEINKLAEIQPVDLVLFDDGIQTGPVPFERKKVSFDFAGRGGTDFTEVFKLAEDRRYQSLIMLTDGCAGAPEKPDFVKDVLWVLTGNGNPPVDWGTRIRIIPKGMESTMSQDAV